MENIDNIDDGPSAFERRELQAAAEIIGRVVREWVDTEGISHRRVTFVPKVSLIDKLSDEQLATLGD